MDLGPVLQLYLHVLGPEQKYQSKTKTKSTKQHLTLSIITSLLLAGLASTKYTIHTISQAFKIELKVHESARRFAAEQPFARMLPKSSNMASFRLGNASFLGSVFVARLWPACRGLILQPKVLMSCL